MLTDTAMVAFNVVGVPLPACVPPGGGWRAPACAAAMLRTLATTVPLPLAFMWIVELRSRRLFVAQQQQQQQQGQQQRQQQRRRRQRRWQTPQRSQQQDSAARLQPLPGQPSSNGAGGQAQPAPAARRSLLRRTWAPSGRAAA